MKGKNLVKILILVFIISTMPVLAQAAYNPPTSVGLPKSVAAEYREDGFEKTWIGFDVNVSASEELREFVDIIGEDNSAFSEAGYSGFELMAQIDYKFDEGNWHYKSEWDEDRGYNTNKSLCRIEKGIYTSSVVFDKVQFESISSGEQLPVTKSYFDTHTMHFRVRFVVNYQDENGEYFGFFSPWSETVSYSNNQKIENPDILINHAPVLKSAELKKNSDGSPYLNIRADKAHEETQLLNNISNDWVKTEVWLKVNNGEWRACHSDNFVEEFNIGAEAYFGLKDSYEAAVYEMKFRYLFDYYHYPAAGKSGVVYSPFSNIISHGMEAYSNASSWAMPELDKANEYGLIPESLKGEDMTHPITREEFAEVAILLYEKSTDEVSVPVSPNPFNDTTNLQILKAFNHGIVKGISATSFAPKELTNREQVATMLSRAIRKIAPNGDFSTSGSPSFSDQNDISSWALEHVQYMAKLEIIKGTDGKFMPKSVTSAQSAAGYATTTREQALAMSLRSFDNMDKIKVSKPDSVSSSSSLVGIWEHTAASGNVGLYISLDLKSDGTFSKTVGTSASYSVSGMGYTGNYSISGDKILFYNQKKGTIIGSSLTDMNFNPSIEDVPVDDTEETFIMKDNNHMMLGDTELFRNE
ncbi:MAG: cell wall-binding protein [Sedimentibacter sp.]|nr:cell wall-binding protein [Sedimentibacter sp.]